MNKTSNLDKCVQAANESGMTYGQYMNQNYDPEAAPPAAEPEEEDLAKVGTKTCEYCGKEFLVYDRRPHKYCCKECAAHANAEKAKRKRDAAKAESVTPVTPVTPVTAPGISDHDKIQIAKMILRNAAECGNENNYLTSIENALDILNYEGAEQ